MTVREPATQQLEDRLSLCKSNQFTGKLEISLSHESGDWPQQWRLFFCLGRLFWATDNVNPNTRMHRYLGTYCPQIKKRKFTIRHGDFFECHNYFLLVVLFQRKVIDREQFAQIVEANLSDLLFDLLQQTATKIPEFTETPYDPLQILKLACVPINSDRVWQQAQSQWEQWQAQDLAIYEPAKVLIIADPQTLASKTQPEVYRKLTAAIDGKRTVRDLAALMRRDAIAVLRSFLPYIRKGIITLTSAPDAPDLITETDVPAKAEGDRSTTVLPAPPTPPTPMPPARRRLVACIDDSPQVCSMMAQILNDLACDAICIQDSTQALTKLLERKPELIFLDLIMPVANGYELCAQIRRITAFKDLPVVILTGSDGIIDRVRAKVVGATDFIGKPVEADKIEAALNKYAPLTSAS
jgi:chemotaxis family two-component system response regulator PixG